MPVRRPTSNRATRVDFALNPRLDRSVAASPARGMPPKYPLLVLLAAHGFGLAWYEQLAQRDVNGSPTASG